MTEIEELRNLIIEKIKKADVVTLRQLMNWGPFISGVGRYEYGELLPETITVCPELGVDVNCTEIYQRFDKSKVKQLEEEYNDLAWVIGAVGTESHEELVKMASSLCSKVNNENDVGD